MTQYPRYLCLLMAFLCLSYSAVALTEEDKNITITSQKDRYEFVTSNKDNPVNIRQSPEMTYRYSLEGADKLNRQVDNVCDSRLP
jgi:hypothetical protein